jgi:hypothetical protein
LRKTSFEEIFEKSLSLKESETFQLIFINSSQSKTQKLTLIQFTFLKFLLSFFKSFTDNFS